MIRIVGKILASCCTMIYGSENFISEWDDTDVPLIRAKTNPSVDTTSQNTEEKDFLAPTHPSSTPSSQSSFALISTREIEIGALTVNNTLVTRARTSSSISTDSQNRGERDFLRPDSDPSSQSSFTSKSTEEAEDLASDDPTVIDSLNHNLNGRKKKKHKKPSSDSEPKDEHVQRVGEASKYIMELLEKKSTNYSCKVKPAFESRFKIFLEEEAASGKLPRDSKHLSQHGPQVRTVCNDNSYVAIMVGNFDFIDTKSSKSITYKMRFIFKQHDEEPTLCNIRCVPL